MGTRGVIARVEGDTWAGRYHHWDSYPGALGKALWQGAQVLGAKRLLELLVDEHPVGWSTIVGHDLRAKPGYLELGVRHPGEPEKMDWDARAIWTQKQGPECYCHGDRHETEAQLIRSTDAPEMLEWAYAISEQADTMTIFYAEGEWKVIGVVHLDESEPNWQLFDEPPF